MGILTLTELKEEIRSGLGGRTDLDSRLTRFLNLAQQRLARIHDFDEMEVLAAGSVNNTGNASDRIVALPSLRELYSVVIEDGSNSRKLRYISPRKWDSALPLPQYWSRRIPSVYTAWGSSIEVYPLPDITYTTRIRHTKWPAAFSDASPNAVSEFNEKDEILIEGAIITAYRSLRQLDEANKRWPNLKGMIEEALKTDREKPDQSISPVWNQLKNSTSDYWVNPWVKDMP